MEIKWRDEMSVDGSRIDEDHRHLIDIINEFEEMSEHFKNAGEALEILYALKFYANTHFEREESLQRLSGYPYHQAHQLEHKDLIKRLDSIILETQNASIDAIKQISIKTSELLVSWLLDHVIKSDLRMRDYVDEMKSHMISLGALKDIEQS
jgi:hemerythrin